MAAPWINFEAGALGKSIDKSNVSPLLFRLKKSELHGPLLQFQSTVVERDDVYKLMLSLNGACAEDKLELARLERAFDVWWPTLENELKNIPEEREASGESAQLQLAPDLSGMLEELIDLTRANHKILRDPSAMLPPDYLEFLTKQRKGDSISKSAVKDAYFMYQQVRSDFKELNGTLSPEVLSELGTSIGKLEGVMEYLFRRV
jgi:hypothetical protein